MLRLTNMTMGLTLPYSSELSVAVVSDVLQQKFSIDESDHTKFIVKIQKNIPANGELYYTVAWLGKDLLIGTNNKIRHRNTTTGKQDRTYIKGSVQCVRSVGNCDVALLIDNDNDDREVKVSFDRSSLGSSSLPQHYVKLNKKPIISAISLCPISTLLSVITKPKE